MIHKLPELGYEYDALEPFIDAKTMEIHYSKHHQAYVNKLNTALEKVNNENLNKKSVKELLENLDEIPESIRQAVINHGGGHYNHSLFWQILKKDIELSGEIKELIENNFESFDKFKEEFSNAAMTQFGSGWAWLVYNPENKKLEITKTLNQDSPISKGLIPVLGLDVWEHAYYLKYQNKRNEYIEAFFSIINWEKVNELIKKAQA